MKKKEEAIILVHGAGVGGWIYKELADLLRKEGYDVYTPTFTGLGERVHLLNKNINLDTHINDIINCINYNGIQNVVLLGHSYGGILVSAIVDRISEKIKKQIYLDSYFFENNTTIMDLLGEEKSKEMLSYVENEGEGWYLPRRLFGKPHPLILDMPVAPYLEKVTITGARNNVPGFFIDCTIDKYFEHIRAPKERAKKICRELNWPIFLLESNHSPMTKPVEREALFKILLEILE